MRNDVYAGVPRPDRADLIGEGGSARVERPVGVVRKVRVVTQSSHVIPVGWEARAEGSEGTIVGLRAVPTDEEHELLPVAGRAQEID